MWNGYTNILYENRLKQQVCKILDVYLSVYMVPICQWVFTCCICSFFDTAAVNFCAVGNFSFWQDKLVSIRSKFTNDLYFTPVSFYAPSFRLTSVILGKRISF